MEFYIKHTTMQNYSNLLLNKSYLIIENEGEEIVLIQVLMQTNECILLESHDDEFTYWRKKTDPIFELIEQLTEEQLEEYQEFFEEDFSEENEEVYL